MSLVFRRRRANVEDPGLFWRPGGHGYTREIADAGLFESGQERPDLPWEEVSALPLLSGEAMRLRQLLAGVDANITACRLRDDLDRQAQLRRLEQVGDKA